ncbi:hypothetical protein T4D_8458 [Trichinella pseudospiralis]|uniref:Uncharacterized protein n=1 Tax=Trichinella pseudospiralis TaxID=6337 RepID=A0A0V1DPG6_TRIPS|nr:hypothetical protein T4D_11238 [Trichinella pseudospiralis]KRY63332.1 hypothetical protein T4D_8458 [Trichinella pseudospiralis]
MKSPGCAIQLVINVTVVQKKHLQGTINSSALILNVV